MADPLSLLREYQISKKEIREDGDYITFGEYSWPKDVKTSFVTWSNKEGEDGKKHYTLGTLYYFLKNLNTAHALYVKKAASEFVTPVHLPDRKELAGYLNGDIDFTEKIDRSLPLDISVRKVVVSNSNTNGLATPTLSSLANTAATGDVGVMSSLQIKSESVLHQKRMKLDLESLQAEKGRLTKELAASKASISNSNSQQQEVTSLSEVIPMDRLEALRAKIREKRQTRIATGAEEGGVINNVHEGSSSVALLMSKDTFPLFRKMPSAELSAAAEMGGGGGSSIDAGTMAEILGRERAWTTRKNVLDSTAKDFFEPILNGILRNVKAKEEGRLLGGVNSALQKHGASNGNNMGVNGQQQQQQNSLQSKGVGYSRYEQEKFRSGRDETGGFKIETMGTYHGKEFVNIASVGANKKADYSSSNSYSAAATIKKESSSSSGPPRDPRQAALESRGTPRSMQELRRGSKGPKVSRTPIIIIPAAPTSLVTMFNVKDLLQELKYVSSAEAKERNHQRELETIIQHQKTDGTTVPYRVIDQPSRLSPDEWDRVVGVFVQGPVWQFKGWPLGSDPQEIFLKVKSFHLHWMRLPLNDNVAQWNVHVIHLDERRHLDKANMQQFWDLLEKHIAKAKAHLRF